MTAFPHENELNHITMTSEGERMRTGTETETDGNLKGG